ncbi:hypothetical protein FIBSPDRAFT_38389 [Athelia psychrophila]|uniref:Uncharacterized protein n=1 Tax=Athelia psychrophila TaxID=1759441 RepID=A0A166FJG7_9AGAM|nr:hypothetical protein FIBSPDRAFT_38389 [Fibularhizoctonia sp. CBS 109695]
MDADHEPAGIDGIDDREPPRKDEPPDSEVVPESVDDEHHSGAAGIDDRESAKESDLWELQAASPRPPRPHSRGGGGVGPDQMARLVCIPCCNLTQPLTA